MRGGRRAVMLLAASVLLIGCGKKSQSEPAEQGPAAIELGSVPASAQAVIGADVGKLYDSRLVARAVAEMFRRDPGLEARFDQIQSDCAIDPKTDVKHVVIGMGGEPDQVILFAAGEFQDKQLATCLNKSMASGGGSVTTASQDGRTLYRVDGGDREVWLAIGGNGVLAVSPSRDWLLDGLSAGPKVAESAAMKPVLARVDRSAAVWVAGRVPASVGAGLVDVTGGKVSQPPEAWFGQTELADGISARFGVIMAGEADAKAAESKAVFELALGAMVAQRFGLGPLVSKVEAVAEGRIVTFSVDLSIADLNELLDTVAAAKPALDSGGAPLQDTSSAKPQN